MSSSEFKGLLSCSNTYKTPSFLIRYKKSTFLKTGFSINKNFGSAVERNECKRKIRALVWSLFSTKQAYFFAFQPRVALNKSINYADEIFQLYNAMLKV